MSTQHFFFVLVVEDSIYSCIQKKKSWKLSPQTDVASRVSASLLFGFQNTTCLLAQSLLNTRKKNCIPFIMIGDFLSISLVINESKQVINSQKEYFYEKGNDGKVCWIRVITLPSSEKQWAKKKLITIRLGMISKGCLSHVSCIAKEFSPHCIVAPSSRAIPIRHPHQAEYHQMPLTDIRIFFSVKPTYRIKCVRWSEWREQRIMKCGLLRLWCRVATTWIYIATWIAYDLWKPNKNEIPCAFDMFA